MYLNQFSVRVIGGHETAGGYVEMRHGQQYKLQLRNGRSKRCDARVEIDGKHVGTWRVEPHSSIVLERPAHDDGRFTFYRLGSLEAANANLDGSDPNLGLVRVTFTPEQVPRSLNPGGWFNVRTNITWEPGDVYRHYDFGYTSDSAPADSLSADQTGTTCCSAAPRAMIAGGTGLSGVSDQHFGYASQIDYDYSQQTVIHLRLVYRDVQRDEPRPLTSYSTPVPPAIR